MIHVKNLAKKFAVENAKKLSQQEKQDSRLIGRFFHSVKDVSFTCDRGQVLGLLGPNGAGKTTTLRLLSTALSPDKGSIQVDGVDLVKYPLEARKKIGFLSGATGLYGRLSGRENIEYFAKLHGMSAQQTRQRVAELEELLQMQDFLDRRCDNYSSGMKQKTSIARAVVHQPKVVIFDEPTTGLDIMATQTVLDFIRYLKKQAIPIIFSTHHLDEVEELCDRLVIVDHGISKFEGSFKNFSNLTKGGLHHSFLHAIGKGEALCG